MSSLNHTVDQMSDMKLHGMKDALLGQMEEPQYSSLTFEERLAHLIDAEVTDRRNKRIKRMLSAFETQVQGRLYRRCRLSSLQGS